MLNNNRLQSIWTVLARNPRCNPYISEKDLATFRRRAKAEGSQFFARDLRSLRMCMLQGLETGQLSLEGCRFRKKAGYALPAFMFEAFEVIFDKCDGRVLEHADAGAVSCVNLLTAVFTKIKGGHTPDSDTRTIEEFVQTERELGSTCLAMAECFNTAHGYLTMYGVFAQAKSLISEVLRGLDPRDISPSHGSGVSAEDVPLWKRFGVPRFIKEIDEIWPMSEYYSAGYTAMCDQLTEFLNAKEEDPCARVLLVPKDVRGQRLISCEPHERMWIQQGVMRSIYERVESHPLTRGLVNFTDQRHNQRAALEGSKPSEHGWQETVTPSGATISYQMPSWYSNPLCTLDLRNASDMLRLDVVERLFPENWVKALKACRSEYTELPDGRIVAMSKHAPMGSATCFPVMALCIWSLLSAVVQPEYRKDILVYGDDIVVRQNSVPDAVRVLEAAGFIVNRNKSFSQGLFRESCGKEYFKGVDVTPIYLRSTPEYDMDSRMSFISFANNYYSWLGYDDDAFIDLVHTWYGTNIPETRGNVTEVRSHLHEETMRITCRYIKNGALTGCLLRDVPNNDHIRSRWNKRLQRREFRVLLTVPREVNYPKDDWSQVLRALTAPRKDPFGSDALARRIRYKWTWVPDMVSLPKE